MVEAVRAGESQRAVARRFHVSLRQVQWWVKRAEGRDLDAVDWTDRSHRPRTIHRTPSDLEARVLRVRRELRERSALGEYGDEAIHRALEARGTPSAPSVRTIARILTRCGALDGRRRVRRPPPPLGWYLPDVAAKRAEVDQVDAIEDLVIEGGIHVDVLTCVSVHGGLPGAWPGPTLTTNRTQEALLEHWQAFGRPTYAQFDNDPRFTGGHRYPDVLGRLVRMCLSLEVTPVFVPPYETGFQAAIESLNARWQSKVWHRFHHESLGALRHRSTRYAAAYRLRLATRLEAAPPRRPFPVRWPGGTPRQPRGRIVWLRRTDPQGIVQVLGHAVPVSPTWPHRLVRCELAVSTGLLMITALRRRDPTDQPVFRTVQTHWALRWARE
jgi:hypothetical protein